MPPRAVCYSSRDFFSRISKRLFSSLYRPAARRRPASGAMTRTSERQVESCYMTRVRAMNQGRWIMWAETVKIPVETATRSNQLSERDFLRRTKCVI